MAAESSFTGITEVKVTASATTPFFDVCRKLDRSSTLIQSYPLGKPTIQNSIYHKGGHLCLLPSFTTGRKHSVEKDKHGRWTIVQLRGQSTVCSITIRYRVCSNLFDLAGNTITDREVHLWNKPREAFLSDLCNVIKNEIQSNRAVFVGGDFNSSILDERVHADMISSQSTGGGRLGHYDFLHKISRGLRLHRLHFWHIQI